MSRTIVDAARAIRPYLPQLAGGTADALGASLTELLAREDSRELRTSLREALSSPPEVANWVAQFLEIGLPDDVESGVDAPPAGDVVGEGHKPLVSVTIPASVLDDTALRDLNADLEIEGVQLSVSRGDPRSVRGPETAIVAINLSATLVSILEGTAGSALWSALRAGLARFISRAPDRESGKDISIVVTFSEHKGRQRVAFHGEGPRAQLAQRMSHIDLASLMGDQSPRSTPSGSDLGPPTA